MMTIQEAIEFLEETRSEVFGGEQITLTLDKEGETFKAFNTLIVFARDVLRTHNAKT